MNLVRQYETQMCIFALVEDGKELAWNCIFKDITHPVNKKLFRMSGAEKNAENK